MKRNDASRLKDKLSAFLESASVLDDAMEKDLERGSDEKAQMREKAAYEAREMRLRRRHENAVRDEQVLYSRIHRWSRSRGAVYINSLYRILAVLLCSAIIVCLMLTVLDMPPLGDALAPVNNEVSQRYIEKGMEETGAVNIVAGMILDYRAFDTLGESTVLFIAACSVLTLLRIDRDKQGHPTEELIAAEADDRHYEPKNDVILQRSAAVLTPIILLFGIYIILNGHLSPGGGFSGGAIIGAGLILYLNAFGFKKTEMFMNFRLFTAVTFSALMFYALAKTYSFYTGANHLHSIISTGTPGNILSAGLILPLNIAVGMVVACTMYAFYALFRKGGM